MRARAAALTVLDAIVEASQELGLRETGKSVIVVISGQGPEFGQRFHQTVLKDLRASRATLHSIVLTRPRTPILRDDVRERELTLTEGASVTGGRREELLTSMSLTKSWPISHVGSSRRRAWFTADPSSSRANVKGYSGEDSSRPTLPSAISSQSSSSSI